MECHPNNSGFRIVRDFKELRAFLDRTQPSLEVTDPECFAVMSYLEDLHATVHVNSYGAILLSGEDYKRISVYETAIFQDLVEYARAQCRRTIAMPADEDPAYLMAIRRDAEILDRLAVRIGPSVTVTITETLQREVVIPGSYTPEEAESLVELAWKNGEYVLDADDFTDVTFKVHVTPAP